MKIGLLQAGHFVPELQSELGDYNALYSRLLAGHGYDFDLETFSQLATDDVLTCQTY